MADAVEQCAFPEIVGARRHDVQTFLVDCEVVAIRNIRTILRNWQMILGFALSWVGAVVGLLAGSAEAAQSLLLTILFPLTFISSAFIPAATLPGPLRAVANWNPVTAVAQSLRECFGNPVTVNPLLPNPVTWASENPQLYSLISICGLLTGTVPLASRALRRL